VREHPNGYQPTNREEIKMFKKSFIYQLCPVLIVMACLCLVLSGCSSTKLTYKASGTAAQAEIEYRDEKGQFAKETVSLPWEKTVSIGDKFSFQVNVTNTTDSGTVICAVSVAGKELGPTTGVTYARCTGNISKQGSSTTWDFHGEYDKPKVAQAPTPTPLKTIPTLSPTRTTAPTQAAPTRAMTATARVTSTSGTPTVTAESLYERGLSESSKGNYDQAIASFTQAMELEPEHPLPYLSRCLVYQYQKLYDAAIVDCKKAIELCLTTSMVYNYLGYTYESKGDLDQAIINYDIAVEIGPKDAAAYANRGHAYESKGNLEQAMLSYNKAIGAVPNYEPTYKYRGLLYSKQGDKAQAIADLETYVRLAPNASDRAQIEQEIRKLKGQ
jgi:regulator of sirC expression with transglutaminase-like and TPR domain